MLYWQELDQQHRLIISKDIIENVSSLKAPLRVAICLKSENSISIHPAEDYELTNLKVIRIVSMDSKNRLIIPAILRKHYSKFMPYVQNGELIIEVA